MSALINLRLQHQGSYESGIIANSSRIANEGDLHACFSEHLFAPTVRLCVYGYHVEKRFRKRGNQKGIAYDAEIPNFGYSFDLSPFVSSPGELSWSADEAANFFANPSAFKQITLLKVNVCKTGLAGRFSKMFVCLIFIRFFFVKLAQYIPAHWFSVRHAAPI